MNVLLLLGFHTIFQCKLKLLMPQTAYGFLRNISILSVLIVLYSCTAVKKAANSSLLDVEFESNELLNQHFYGFVLYDPITKKYLHDKNGDMYFTPASNTKVLTLAATLAEFPDRIPSFFEARYRNRQLLIPLGDPTFLHPDFPVQKAFRDLQDYPGDTLFIGWSAPPDIYGPGWAWDDYMYDFQPERTNLPIFGNVVRTTRKGNEYQIQPEFFESFVEVRGKKTFRSRDYNYFSIPEDMPDSVSRDIPFRHSAELIEVLLTDTLQRPVRIIPIDKQYTITDTIYNGRTRDALSIMMTRSDNFIAEQLLLMGQNLRGFSTVKEYIEFIKEVRFPVNEKELIWVDGSGLSRYNMVTPKSMIQVLEQIFESITEEELEFLFPVGGVSGNLKDWYAGNPEPYIFAKTGTLRHNHNLSGYIKTRRGRLLLFSFMNNHYPTGSSPVKIEMQKILEFVRDNY